MSDFDDLNANLRGLGGDGADVSAGRDPSREGHAPGDDLDDDDLDDDDLDEADLDELDLDGVDLTGIEDEPEGVAATGGVGGGAPLGDLDDLDPDQRDQIEAAQQAMEEARARLADVPAEVVVTNHVMGLYELAAIHLSADTPDLVQAALAIDAVACLVDGLGDRLGPDAPTMVEALNNIRLAFVQIKG